MLISEVNYFAIDHFWSLTLLRSQHFLCRRRLSAIIASMRRRNNVCLLFQRESRFCSSKQKGCGASSVILSGKTGQSPIFPDNRMTGWHPKPEQPKRNAHLVPLPLAFGMDWFSPESSHSSSYGKRWRAGEQAARRKKGVFLLLLPLFTDEFSGTSF